MICFYCYPAFRVGMAGVESALSYAKLLFRTYNDRLFFHISSAAGDICTYIYIYIYLYIYIYIYMDLKCRKQNYS